MQVSKKNLSDLNLTKRTSMTIVLDGSSLTIEKLVKIARFGEKVELDLTALERIKVCRAMLEKKLAAKKIMYGTNTGIGSSRKCCSRTSR